MPVSARISDAELRLRLEDHAYNVPPITDTTRAILIKKLNQLDSQRSTSLRNQGTGFGAVKDSEYLAFLIFQEPIQGWTTAVPRTMTSQHP